MGLLMKLIYAGRLETCRQFVDAIKLPYHIVAELVRMAIDRHVAAHARNARLRQPARSGLRVYR